MLTMMLMNDVDDDAQACLLVCSDVWSLVDLKPLVVLLVLMELKSKAPPTFKSPPSWLQGKAKSIGLVPKAKSKLFRRQQEEEAVAKAAEEEASRKAAEEEAARKAAEEEAARKAEEEEAARKPEEEEEEAGQMLTDLEVRALAAAELLEANEQRRRMQVRDEFWLLTSGEELDSLHDF